MKTVKLNNLEIKECETIEDINIKRYMAVKEWYIMKESGQSIPDQISMFKRYVKGFDNESKSQMLLAIRDHLQGLRALENGQDPHQMIYALITIEEGEKEWVTDHTFLQEKLERYSKAGLNQKQVVIAVENFLIALFK